MLITCCQTGVTFHHDTLLLVRGYLKEKMLPIRGCLTLPTRGLYPHPEKTTVALLIAILEILFGEFGHFFLLMISMVSSYPGYPFPGLPAGVVFCRTILLLRAMVDDMVLGGGDPTPDWWTERV